MLHEKARRIIGAARLEGDRLLQDAADAREKSLHLVVAQTIDRAARIDGRSEQRLIGVQIADASDHILRKEQRFDPTAPLV